MSGAEGSGSAEATKNIGWKESFGQVLHGQLVRRRAAGFAALSRPPGVAWNHGTGISAICRLDKLETGERNQQRFLVPQNDHNESLVGALTSSQGRLYAYILTLLPHPEAARDVLQETNLVIWRKSAEAPEGSAFIGWSFRIAQLQVMAYLRDRGRERRRFNDQLMEVMDPGIRHAATTADDRMAALEHCLEKLDPASRDLIVKRYGSTGSVEELGQMLGKTANAVSRSLYRIRLALLGCIAARVAREQ